MDQAQVMAETPQRDHLSCAEIGAAIEALTSAEKLKLSAIDEMMRGGTGLGKGDLVQEAVLRALDGSRNCPRHVPIMAFLVETMRSIAGHERTKHGRIVFLADLDGTVPGVTDPSAAGRDAEHELIAKQEIAAVQGIYALFSDDDEAQLVLMGWNEELRGAALREATGLDQGKLDYAIKRIRTRIRKLYPKGQIT
jgi:DNA-directed RNA polymerase specialized sigma24 family protein